MSPDEVLAVLHLTVTEVRRRLDGLGDWGLAGTRDGQYRSDLAADSAALDVLGHAGLGVLSEESGLHDGDREIVAVIDPVDGSTNASRGLPWWATSVCALDRDGPLAAVVANQATGTRFEAVRGGGARCDGEPISPSAVDDVGAAIVSSSGYPPAYGGWSQYRCLGAAALDLCAVASGALDGFVDWGGRSLATWDYMGGLLVCREAGAIVGEAFGRDLAVVDPGARRTIVAGSTQPVYDALAATRTAGRPLP